MDKKNFIAKRAAAYFKTGDVVNLGVGIPGLCSNYAAEGVMFEAENGFVGCGSEATGLQKLESFSDASGMEFVPAPGGVGIDSSVSFGMIRGGRLDATVLGALQVDQEGNLANWSLPGRVFGMGGAMDIVNGTKKVIVAMELCNKKGESKLVKHCTLPLTGKHCVDHIVCEYGVIDVTEHGLEVVELAEGVTKEDFAALVSADITFSENLKIMNEDMNEEL